MKTKQRVVFEFGQAVNKSGPAVVAASFPSLPSVKISGRTASGLPLLPPVESPSGLVAFDIVIEYGAPVAILCPERISAGQLNNLYLLLPNSALMDDELARRWNLETVLCDPEWARQQKKRVPMLRPRTPVISLAFCDNPIAVGRAEGAAR